MSVESEAEKEGMRIFQETVDRIRDEVEVDGRIKRVSVGRLCPRINSCSYVQEKINSGQFTPEIGGWYREAVCDLHYFACELNQDGNGRRT